MYKKEKPKKTVKPKSKTKKKTVKKPPVISTDRIFKGSDGVKYHITLKQQIFCETYLETSNQTLAALEAYAFKNKKLCMIEWSELSDADKIKRRKAENAAATLGKKLVRNGQINEYLNRRLADVGFISKKVWKKHYKNMMQDESVSASNTAIDMYYKTKGEYAAQKLQHGIDERMEEFLKKQDRRLR